MPLSDDEFENLQILTGGERDVDTWRDEGRCQNLYPVYDLPDREDTPSRRQRMKINREHLSVARPICFECPVFTACWDDAYDNIDITLGVIRAGALLNSEVKNQRLKRLVVAHELYLQYHERKPHGRPEEYRGLPKAHSPELRVTRNSKGE
ncbi:hypothetical protein PBI_CHIDIEBERE_124 [Gordonia phage Chidiebere]|uniref:WhiB family transcription factor n=1 Tax=Gordonia phage Chidiebere TaxID=2656530 RepID=A0A649VKS7_9CAUD|nr:hypothetical protein PQD14_gp124 [Gordonia phage Chidiebere]QGJ93010.1 hypothetical protein PBI_CHIDIEBERE_124 [Gordonia phage Chidiebere]